MFEGFDIWKLLAGLGIFMFGMFLLEESIKKLSGKAFNQSSKQILLALKELILSDQKSAKIESIQEINRIIIEYE